MKLELYQSNKTNPHYNLALEHYLLETCPLDTVRFYLWQNEHSLILGKNQHALSEVNHAKLVQDNGTLARRCSGGKAVYQDLGQLNFSFIAFGALFNIPKQLGMITQTLCKLGYSAYINEQNDVEMDGAKVAYHAFAHLRSQHLHHGILFVHTETSRLRNYLFDRPKYLTQMLIREA